MTRTDCRYDLAVRTQKGRKALFRHVAFETNLNRHWAAFRGVIPAAGAPMVGQMRTWIPRFGLLELLAHLSAGSCFELNGKVRTLFGAASIIVGMSVSLSSALADIEEATSQDPLAPDYTQHALPRESMIHFLMDNYDGLTGTPRPHITLSQITPMDNIRRIRPRALSINIPRQTLWKVLEMSLFQMQSGR